MNDTDPYTGEIRLFAGVVVPRGWALCDGQLLDRNQYEPLFDLIANTYGGDGVSTFALPDLRGRTPLHQGTGTGLSARVVGQRGGAEQVVLRAEHLPRHRHRLRGTESVADSGSPVAGSVLAQAVPPARAYVGAPAAPDPNEPLAAGTLQDSGDSPATSHENRMPSLALNFLICLEGMHP